MIHLHISNCIPMNKITLLLCHVTASFVTPDQRLANCLDSGSCPSDNDLGLQEEGKIPMSDPAPL